MWAGVPPFPNVDADAEKRCRLVPPRTRDRMRIPLVVYLAPLTLALACSDEGPVQNAGPKLTISPDTVSVETGADPITLQAVPQNGDLTGNVTWALLSGTAGTLANSNGQTV